MRLKNQGVTLLEVMLATALILLALVIGTVQYKKTILRQNATKIQNSVTFLGNALQQYYNVNCYWFLTDPNSYSAAYTIALNKNPSVVPTPSSNTEPNPTLIDYIPNPESINNPYAVQPGLNAYTYQIDTQGDFPILTVSTQFSSNISSSLWSFLQGRLKPSSVNAASRTFTWNIVRNQPAKKRFNGLNANLNYVNAMAGNLYLDIGGGQYGMHIITPVFNLPTYALIGRYPKTVASVRVLKRAVLIFPLQAKEYITTAIHKNHIALERNRF